PACMTLREGMHNFFHEIVGIDGRSSKKLTEIIRITQPARVASYLDFSKNKHKPQKTTLPIVKTTFFRTVNSIRSGMDFVNINATKKEYPNTQRFATYPKPLKIYPATGKRRKSVRTINKAFIHPFSFRRR